MSEPLTVRPPEPDAAKRARKRFQNRLNQRARRARVREVIDDNGNSKHPFRVRKWRLNQDGDQADHPMSTRELVPRRDHHLHGQMWERGPTTWLTSVLNMYIGGRFNPFADGLLHLIHENIYHALAYNKIVFHQNVEELVTDYDSVSTDDSAQSCLHLSLTLPLTGNMPVNLFPTQLQQTVPHSTWINAIPFPRMRDNLITWQDSFDHAEFLIDLVGFLMDLNAFRKPRRQDSPGVTTSTAGFESEEEDDRREVPWRGAIIWGEPFLIESWEFTALFLKKWAWTVEGCEDAIRVSNSWRNSRGMAPLRRTQYTAKT